MPFFLGMMKINRPIACVFFVLLFSTIFGIEPLDYFPQETWLQEYLDRMPWHLYKQYKVEGLGKYWVDNAADCVKDTIKQGKIWETYLIYHMKKWVKPGDAVVDIGAHMGTITLALSNLVGAEGKVFAFEAERQFFRELYYNIQLNEKRNVKPHLCLIGEKDEDQTIRFYYLNDAPLKYSPVYDAKELPYTLHKRTLDSFHLPKITLMKIDVLCTEDKVLEGAKNTIMESRPIMIIEIMGGYGNCKAASVKKRIHTTIKKIESMDYRVSKILIDDYLAIPIEKTQ